MRKYRQSLVCTGLSSLGAVYISYFGKDLSTVYEDAHRYINCILNSSAWSLLSKDIPWKASKTYWKAINLLQRNIICHGTKILIFSACHAKIIPQAPNSDSKSLILPIKHLYFPIRDVLSYKFFSSFSSIIQTFQKQYTKDPKMLSSFGTQDSSKVTGSPNNA